MIELLGWISAIAFMLGAVPFAIQAHRLQRTEAPWSAIGLVFVGSSGMVLYELLTAQSWPQIGDFGLTSVCWAYVAWIKWKSKGD